MQVDKKKIKEAIFSVVLGILFYPCLLISFKPLIKNRKINRNIFLFVVEDNIEEQKSRNNTSPVSCTVHGKDL